MPLDRAYTTLEVKSVDLDARVIEGLATTPTPDRIGDVMDPAGAEFALPMPLLWQHQLDQPIGDVTEATVTPAGIRIIAKFARVEEPGPLRDRLDMAWQSVKARLVRGFSVGFQKVKCAPRKDQAGGLHISQWRWAETSVVTLPMNIEATITNIKSAAGGHPPEPSLPVVRVKDARPMHSTYSEQITSHETTRKNIVQQMADLMAKADADGVTLDSDQTTRYDGFASQVKSLDGHLVRLREMESLNVAAAVPVPASPSPLVRPIVQVKSNVPPGTGFIRYCQAMAYGRGDSMRAIEFAKQWKDSTPEVELVLKAAIAPGTTTDATWAAPLVQLQPLASEFLDLLRPATILGKIPGFVRVPFNVSIASQTGGGTYAWVGQGAPKPVGKLQFGTTTITFAKCAGIIVITIELARFSSPSAEDAIRNDMIRGMAAFLDLEFTDPTKAAVANVSPGSVTNGVTPITTAGTTPANARTDLQALLNAIVAAGLPVNGTVVLMSETNALALTSALNPLGQALFPGMGVMGGSALGLTVITSQAVGTNVIALQPSCILLADDGGVNIDVSTEASVQMDSAPDNPALATTVMTSLWQNNLVGLRAERFINWKKARTGCVQYTVATYAA